MSKQLAISSALSVLAMSMFVLFGPQAAKNPLGTEAQASPVRIVAPVAR